MISGLEDFRNFRNPFCRQDSNPLTFQLTIFIIQAPFVFNTFWVCEYAKCQQGFCPAGIKSMFSYTISSSFGIFLTSIKTVLECPKKVHIAMFGPSFCHKDCIFDYIIISAIRKCLDTRTLFDTSPEYGILSSQQREIFGVSTVSEEGIMGLKLGSYIKSCRREQRKTSIVLSKEAGISKTYLDYIESGKREPQVNILAKIAATLQVPLGPMLKIQLQDQLEAAITKAHLADLGSVKSLEELVLTEALAEFRLETDHLSCTRPGSNFG